MVFSFLNWGSWRWDFPSFRAQSIFFSSIYGSFSCSLSLFVHICLFLTLFGCTVITAWESSSSLVSMISVSVSAVAFFTSSETIYFLLEGSWSASWWTPGAGPWEAADTTACASSSLPGSARRPRALRVDWLKGTSWPTPHPWWRERGWSAGWWRSDLLALSSSGMFLTGLGGNFHLYLLKTS